MKAIIDLTSPGRVTVTLDGERIGSDYPNERAAREAIIATMQERGWVTGEPGQYVDAVWVGDES